MQVMFNNTHGGQKNNTLEVTLIGGGAKSHRCFLAHLHFFFLTRVSFVVIFFNVSRSLWQLKHQ